MPRTFLLSLLFTAWLLPMAARAEPVEIRWAKFEGNYRAKLAELSAWVAAHQLADAAEFLHAWLPETRADRLVLYVINDRTKHLEVPTGASADQQHWATEFRALRETAGKFLVVLARQAVEEKQYSLAMRLLHAAVREDPNQLEARTALGYERIGDQWLTPYAKAMHERGLVWNDRFGWLAAADLPRYEAGERKVGLKWMSAADDAARRKAILAGWEIRTDHYRVTTNRSLEAGVALAMQLERMYQLWRQLFVEYYASPDDLQKLLAGKASEPSPARPHDVYLYRDKADYVRDLQAAQPQIEKTIGIYFDNRRRAYFFVGEENYEGNVYHEATHQLFQETRRVPRNIGLHDNFWIVEGIAVYFESLAPQSALGYCTLGGLEAGRVPAARQRMLTDGYYVPFERLTSLGTAAIQQDRNIAKLYSQAAGQTAFLMQGRGGKYRSALLRYISDVYTNRAEPGTLFKLTGASGPELDRQYQAFLQSGE
jgi:hypothetical protein